MLKLQSYRFRLKVGRRLRCRLASFAGCSRKVWNLALNHQKSRLDQGDRALNYPELCRLLTTWRHQEETFYLAEAPVHPLQQSLKNLDRALRDAFSGKKQFPRFKCKRRHDSFRYPDPRQFHIEGDRIRLPKLGTLRFKKTRAIRGTPKNVTITKSGCYWMVAIQTEEEVPDPLHPSSSTIGLDLGIVNLVTLSDGTHFPPLHPLAKHLGKLSRENRILARRKKYSQNWKKQRLKLAKLHAHLANARRDYLHKITTAISNNHAIVVMEDLRVSQMSQSAKGTQADPGKRVRVKAKLNRSILDQGWHELRRQLAYKLQWLGGKLLVVDPSYTSQTCPSCGHCDPGNRLSQARFCCQICSHQEHADIVGAKNVLAVGHTVSACGDTGSMRTLAQESPRL